MVDWLQGVFPVILAMNLIQFSCISFCWFPNRRINYFWWNKMLRAIARHKRIVGGWTKKLNEIDYLLPLQQECWVDIVRGFPMNHVWIRQISRIPKEWYIYHNKMDGIWGIDSSWDVSLICDSISFNRLETPSTWNVTQVMNGTVDVWNVEPSRDKVSVTTLSLLLQGFNWME